MRFSIKVQYGLQALLELALNYGSGPMQIAEIAKAQKIPVRFLEQLMLQMKRGGLAASTRGIHGGYTLAKRPSAVTLLEVVEVFDGPIELVRKDMKKIPVLLEAIKKIEDGTKAALSGVSLEELALKKRQKDQAYVYNI